MKMKIGPCFDGLCCFLDDPQAEDWIGWRKSYGPGTRWDIRIEYDVLNSKGKWVKEKAYRCKYLDRVTDGDEFYFRCSVYNQRQDMGILDLLGCTTYPEGRIDRCKAHIEGEIKNLKMFIDEKEVEVPKNKKFIAHLQSKQL
ncbi:MAG: hypothetical protein PHW96_01470 [Candidatus Nanoarchaeia archaeon]|nr:hypothetical protein [Candidatus Nanoarchaeia archaeon]